VVKIHVVANDVTTKVMLIDMWQFIETAPHDGITWILGYEKSTGETGILIFDNNPEEMYSDEHADVWTDGYRVWHPTHWMPLPEPPENINKD
jgi:hypothetical protein